MPDYRRWYSPGGVYFFTVVTYDRQPIFAEPSAVSRLGTAMREVRSTHPFRTIAAVILPDHLHTVWQLPRGDADFSTRWRRIKGLLTKRHLRANLPSTNNSAEPPRGLWQPRFWEHMIRDEIDLERHVDYIHYNPVKHGLVARPLDWPWSSLRRYINRGHYDVSWGMAEPLAPRDLPRE